MTLLKFLIPFIQQKELKVYILIVLLRDFTEFGYSKPLVGGVTVYSWACKALIQVWVVGFVNGSLGSWSSMDRVWLG